MTSQNPPIRTVRERRNHQRRSHHLRGKGLTWEHIAAVFQVDYPDMTPLAAFRLAHGMSQDEVADKCRRLTPGEPTMTRARIYEMENWPQAGRRPSVDSLRVLAQIFHTTGRSLLSEEAYDRYSETERDAIARIDFRHLDERQPQVIGDVTAASLNATIAASDGQNEDDDVKRRAWLTGQVALAVVGTAALTSPAHAASTSTVGPGDVEILREVLAALTVSDRHFGGGRTRDSATEYLRAIVQPKLKARGGEQVKRELFAVATQFTLRVASMHDDSGHSDISRTLLAAGASYAEESRDITLLAWVLSRRGEQDLGEDVARALAYTAAAAALSVHAPPLARAFLLAKHALALSRTGDRAETLRALKQVRDAHDKVGPTAEPEWVKPYGLGHLLHDEGRCYSNLGMGTQAVRAAKESMRVGRRDRFARPRAFTLGLQALGHVQSGEIDRACATGHELVRVASQLNSSRVTSRVRTLLGHLAPYQDVAAVRDLNEAARPILAAPKGL